MAGRDGVLHLHDFPLHARIDHGALVQLPVDPCEPALTERSRSHSEIRAASRRSGTGGAEVRVRGRVSVAVLTLDLDGVAVLAVELPVAVLVLREVAVGAVHAPLEVD